MTFLCRCANATCRKRRALRRKPEDYIRPPQCVDCGGRRYHHDIWQERKNAEAGCNCSGYWFRHRRGSKWCEHAEGTVTLPEAAERWGGEPVDYVFCEDQRLGRCSGEMES